MQWHLTAPIGNNATGKKMSHFLQVFLKHQELFDTVYKTVATDNLSGQAVPHISDSTALKWRYHWLSCDYVPVRYIF